MNDSSDSVLDSIEIISIHLPKTAGSTFGRIILPQIYSPEQIYYDYESLPVKVKVVQEKIPSLTKVIHGHFAPIKYQQAYPTANIIVWLRNPINYLISLYYYWLTFPPTDPNSTDFHKYIVNNQIGFEDFIDLQEAQNTLSKSYFPEINLEKFHFIGIQEFFREDLRELQHLLNWPEVKIKPSNGNTYPDYKARVRNILGDRQLIRKIATVNREDMELYQAALNLRGKRKGLSNSLQQYQVCLQASQQRLLYTEVVPQKDKAVLDTINTLHN